MKSLQTNHVIGLKAKILQQSLNKRPLFER